MQIKKLYLPLQPQTRNNGAIAQLVEQRTENPCVPGSIPGGTTENQRWILWKFTFGGFFYLSTSSVWRIICIFFLVLIHYRYYCISPYILFHLKQHKIFTSALYCKHFSILLHTSQYWRFIYHIVWTESRKNITIKITPIRDKIAISCMLRQIHESSSHAIRHGLYIKNRKRLFCP